MVLVDAVVVVREDLPEDLREDPPDERLAVPEDFLVDVPVFFFLPVPLPVPPPRSVVLPVGLGSSFAFFSGASELLLPVAV